MDTDILTTRGPPAHHLDLGFGLGFGCLALLNSLWKLRPKLHVYGHIHAARGVEMVSWTEDQSAYAHILGGKGGWWDIIGILRGVFRALWIKKSSQPGNKSGKTTTDLVRQLF